MNGMLGRASGNSAPVVSVEVLAVQGQKRRGAEWQHQAEPNSVLDIRSPSPSSTLSCSLGGSSESGAVAGVFCEAASEGHGHLPDPNANNAWHSRKAKSNAKEEEEPKEEGPAQAQAEEWADRLGIDDLEGMLFESASPPPDHSFMRWLRGEMEEPPHAQIKPGSGEGTDGMLYVDPGAFSFPTNGPGDAVGPATPSMVPSPPYHPALPLPAGVPSNPRLHSSSGLEPGPLTFVPGLPCFQPEPAFLPPNPPFFNPFKMSADPAPPAPLQQNHQNSVFFPVSDAKRHHGAPEIVQRPSSLQWQQQEQVQAGWQAAMVKPEQPDAVVALHGRLLLPQFHRQRGIVINNNKAGSDEVQLTMVEQLLKAAEAVEIGNLGFAQAILARLNQHLSPLGKPLHRAAFYFKEALSSRLLLHNTTAGPNAAAPSPLDIVHRIGAYKSFSEFSPLAQFANFTANQALLESLKGAQAIHVVDFEIGLGGQWASFLQEIALQIGGPPALRLTAVGSNDSVEMHLARENLCHFAEDLNVSFEFGVVEVERLECLTPAVLQLREREAIAINFSLGMHRFLSGFSSGESIVSLLRLLKQLSPKAIVVVDNESERNGVSFVQQFLEALQFYSFLFDSLDASNMNVEAIHKIEKFLMAPKIHNVVAAKRRPAAPNEKAPPWRNLFVDAGFSPMSFSNITETQAEYLIARMQGRGFEVSKTHGSLLLVWQGRPLVAASVWRC